MGGDWQAASLRKNGVVLIDCDHRTPPAESVGYPYVTIPHIKQGRIDLSDVRRISKDHFSEWTRKANPQPFDVVLSRRCNPGETAFVPPGLEFALGQNLVLLRADGTKIDKKFLRWLVRGPAWWEQVQKFINVGAVFDSLRCSDIPNFELPIPPLKEQRVISHILDSLDDKIDLNRRTNETLEAMAQALFQSWFVDFDPVRAKAEGRAPAGMDAATAALFPDGFEGTEAGDIPISWQPTTLKELTSKIGSGATPKGGDSTYVDEGIAFIRSQNVYDSEFVWDGLVRLKDSDAEQLKGVTVQPDDVLLNITGASILRTCVVEPAVLPARVNQHVAIVRAREGIPCRYLHFHLLRPSTKAYLLGLDAGASRQAVTKGHIESVPILLPPVRLLSRFAEVTKPMFATIDNLRAQSRTLAALRDTLLPKLLSGELRVGEAEAAVGRAL